jgi:hypothetical protein
LTAQRAKPIAKDAKKTNPHSLVRRLFALKICPAGSILPPTEVFMHIFRPLFLSSLLALCVAPLAAQSSSDKPASSSPLLPAWPPNAQASADLFQFLEPFDIRGVTLRPTVPAADSKDNSQDMIPQDLTRQRVFTLEENQPVCYTLRTYRVARETPDSYSTRPAGYSTCQRASRFKFKTAVDTREIAPH